LKKAVRGVIPDELIDRKKQGFGVPVYEWFFDKLGDTMKTTLKKFCTETDYFDLNTVNQLIDNKQATQVWYLYNLAKWWETYL
jgi:asparagine synthase (glutamine-hydrolysing)